VIAACKAAGFDLVLVETSGIGQGDAAIVPHVDASLYVMTPEYGAASQQRATAALAAGLFADEIAPITVTMGVADKVMGLTTKKVTVSDDEGIRAGTTVEGIRGLRSAVPGGLVSAGNASQFSDGGGACVVMHEALEACVVTGANLGQPLGIAMLNAEFAALAGDPAARSDLESSLVRHLEGVNATLDPHEQLACLCVVTTAWTVDNDIITPTFKVKRNRIEELYAVHYESWERSGSRVIWQAA
jgi:hypothetical protein